MGSPGVPIAHLKGDRLEWSSRECCLNPANPHDHRLETFLAAVVPVPQLLPSPLDFHVSWAIWGLCGI